MDSSKLGRGSIRGGGNIGTPVRVVEQDAIYTFTSVGDDEDIVHINLNARGGDADELKNQESLFMTAGRPRLIKLEVAPWEEEMDSDICSSSMSSPPTGRLRRMMSRMALSSSPTPRARTSMTTIKARMARQKSTPTFQIRYTDNSDYPPSLPPLPLHDFSADVFRSVRF